MKKSKTIVIVCLMCSITPVLRAGADAPPDRYTVASATVYDTRTGLTWQQAVDANMYTQLDASTYCASLALAGGGWRLPAVSELLTLVDPTKSNPAIDPTAFPSTPEVPFWSSSAYVGTAGATWVVYFDYGHSGNFDASSTYRVRCVR